MSLEGRLHQRPLKELVAHVWVSLSAQQQFDALIVTLQQAWGNRAWSNIARGRLSEPSCVAGGTGCAVHTGSAPGALAVCACDREQLVDRSRQVRQKARHREEDYEN